MHHAAAAELAAAGGDVVAVVGLRHRRDGGVRAHRRARHAGEARDELDHLAHRHVAVGIGAVVAIAGQAALPVGRQQPQRVPALAPPGVRHLAALEHHVIDRPLGETPARREAGVPGPDDDRGDAFDGSRSAAPRDRSDDFDGDVHRVGDDVVHRRALLRLRDDRLDLLLRRIRVDLERDLDVVVAVAHVAVDAEDAADVHRAFELRLDRPQLDAAILRHRGDAGGQAAREADEHVLDRRDAVILGGEDLRMIGLERVSVLCCCSWPRPKKPWTFVLLCVPFCHLQDARHVNFAASGAPFSASRASSSAWTLTPLLTLAIAIVKPLSGCG